LVEEVDKSEFGMLSFDSIFFGGRVEVAKFEKIQYKTENYLPSFFMAELL